MKKLVIIPGGFHPFHAGHMALYNAARETFPSADIYVAATDDTSTRPFRFDIKEKLARLAGVPAHRFIQVESPFKAREITQHYDADNTQLIFVRSEKDRGERPQPGGTLKDGTPSYLQPYRRNGLEPLSKHGYIAYLPTVQFGPGMTSATEIRGKWPAMDDTQKSALVNALYPVTQGNEKLTDVTVKMLDAGMGIQESITEEVLDEGLKEKLVAAGMAGIMALTALAPTAAKAEVQKEPTKAMKVVKQTDMGSGVKRTDFKDGSHSIADASGITVYDAAGKVVQKVSPRVSGYQQTTNADGSTSQELDMRDQTGLGAKISQAGGKTSATMNIAGSTISNEAEDRIVPQGGLGSYTPEALEKAVAEHMMDVIRFMKAGEYDKVDYMLYKWGVIESKVKALKDYYEKMRREQEEPNGDYIHEA